MMLTACGGPWPTPAWRASAHPPSPSPVSTAVTPTLAPADFVAIAHGIERRDLTVLIDARRARLLAFRIDPARTEWRVRYAPGRPAVVSAWERSAALVFNAGYFDENDAALALLITDGQRFGSSYENFGGMLAVDAGGGVRVRSLVAEPYAPEEMLTQAIQSFPMLIYPDGSTFAKEDGDRARRTAVAQDANGLIYVFIAPESAWTLVELATTLKALDWDLVIALNLDGGGSTGFYTRAGEWHDSFTPVPAVVVVASK